MPGIVWNNSGHASCVARQSATIVADNRLALPPSLAVEYSRILSFLAPCWRRAAAPSLLRTLFRPGSLASDSRSGVAALRTAGLDDHSQEHQHD
jgi:hypothetical protein